MILEMQKISNLNNINRDFKLKMDLSNIFSISLPSEYSGSNVPNLARLDYFLSCYGRFP